MSIIESLQHVPLSIGHPTGEYATNPGAILLRRIKGLQAPGSTFGSLIANAAAVQFGHDKARFYAGVDSWQGRMQVLLSERLLPDGLTLMKVATTLTLPYCTPISVLYEGDGEGGFFPQGSFSTKLTISAANRDGAGRAEEGLQISPCKGTVQVVGMTDGKPLSPVWTPDTLPWEFGFNGHTGKSILKMHCFECITDPHMPNIEFFLDSSGKTQITPVALPKQVLFR